MPVIVPITSSVRQIFTTQLGEWSFGFYFYYNDRSERWIVDLYDATTGLPLVLGQPVVLGQDFLEPYVFRIGTLFAFDITVHHGEAGVDDLGNRVILPYFTPAETGDVEVFPPFGEPTEPDGGSPVTPSRGTIYGGVGIAGGGPPVTVLGTQVALNNGVVLNQLAGGENIGQSWIFSPNNQYVYLLLRGSARTFIDDISGFKFVCNSPPTSVTVNAVAMYLYQSTNMHAVPVQPRLRT